MFKTNFIITLLLLISMLFHVRAQELDSIAIPDSTTIDSISVSSDINAIEIIEDDKTNDSLLQVGYVKVTGNNRLGSLIQKYVEINQDDCPNIISGFRVQIFSSSGTGSSQKAREARTKFLTFYPSLKAYTDYEAPNFRVRVGDFRTKLEAEKIKKSISQEFPASFIVPDFVNTVLSREACQE